MDFIYWGYPLFVLRWSVAAVGTVRLPQGQRQGEKVLSAWRSAFTSASTSVSELLQADTISSVLLDRCQRVVRRTVHLNTVRTMQRLNQHGVDQSAHVLAKALHSSH